MICSRVKLMEYRGSGGHLLCWSIPQCFNAFPIPPISLSVSIHSIAIAPSLMPAIQKPASVTFSSTLLAPIHFKTRHIFVPFVCSTFHFQKLHFIFSLFSYNVQKLLSYYHVFTVLFPGPCTCAIIQYLSPKLQTAVTHSILNQFFSFLGCVLAFIQTKCMQIYRA